MSRWIKQTRKKTKAKCDTHLLIRRILKVCWKLESATFYDGTVENILRHLVSNFGTLLEYFLSFRLCKISWNTATNCVVCDSTKKNHDLCSSQRRNGEENEVKKKYWNQKRCEKQMISKERDINISEKMCCWLNMYAHIRGGYETGANI